MKASATLSGTDAERLYIIDLLRESDNQRGRPAASEQERTQWLAAAERPGWDSARLAGEWGIRRAAVRRRLRLIRPEATQEPG